ncbi:MAG: hypothetical protein IJ268_07755 [Proteobacteria bacterium]|nr:hypothetical protein [Pseudomonadota bacterium]
MLKKFSSTNRLFFKAFFALLIAVVLSIFCTSHFMQPEMRESGNAIHINPHLLQDMLSASVKDKSLAEIGDYLAQRKDPFLNQAQVSPISELISQEAPQKYGLWLRNNERMRLLSGIPFSIGDFQPQTQPDMHPGTLKSYTRLPNHNNDPYHPNPPETIQNKKITPPIEPSVIVPKHYRHISFQSLIASMQHITAHNPYMAPRHPHHIEHRSAFLIIPVKNSPYVIFAKRPQPLPPVIPWSMTLFSTGMILLIILVTVLILILPIAFRITRIATACQRVKKGDYTARCNDPKKDFIGTLAANIDDITESIETHIDQQKSLLQAIAHELRTPLSRIRFTLEMLDLPEDDENAQARLASIDEDLTEIDNLTKELSYFNYVDAGNGRRNFETSAVKDLVELTLKQRSLALQPFEVDVIGLDDSYMIEADPNAFKRVIGNLLSNAARYAKKHIRLSVKQDTDENAIVISVDDDGPGIPEDKRASIFDPFVCLEQSRSKSTGGFGLGLAIAHRIMKIHSGSISAQASDLGGARFVTTWPLTQS